MADTRYIVSWTPLVAVVQKCRALGMKDDDGTSFWDWIEPDECEHHTFYPTFKHAVWFAKRVATADVFGEARIEREILTADHDDLGNTFRTKSWQADARWEIATDSSPTESNPDVTLEAA